MPDPQDQTADTSADDILPASGGSYLRQPDGSLVRTDIDPATNPDQPADQAGNSTPEQE